MALIRLIHDLDFVAVMDGIPGAELFHGGFFDLREFLGTQLAVGLAFGGRHDVGDVRQDAVVDANKHPRIRLGRFCSIDDSDLAIAELLLLVKQHAHSAFVAVGPQGAVDDGERSITHVDPGRVDLAVSD